MKYLLLLLTLFSYISAMNFLQTQETIEAEYNTPFVVRLYEANQDNWTCMVQNSTEVLLISEEFVSRKMILTYTAVKPTLLKFICRELDATGRPIRILEEKTFNIVLRPATSKY